MDKVDFGISARRSGSIGCIAAAAIDVVDNEGAVGILFVEHIDSNFTADVAVDITATEGVGHGAAKEVEGDILGDIGSFGSDIVGLVGRAALRATEDIGVGTAIDIERDGTRDVSQVDPP